MPQQQLIVAVVQRGRGMLRMHLNDFTEAEMLARPVPTANHAAYQLCHLLRTTGGMLNVVAPDANVAIPPKVEGDTKGSPTSDDPAAFPKKDELLDTWEAMTDAAVTAVKAMSDADFDQSTPEQFQNFAPTVGQLALMLPLHMSMHVGQIQVARRALGKPRLF